MQKGLLPKLHIIRYKVHIIILESWHLYFSTNIQHQHHLQWASRQSLLGAVRFISIIQLVHHSVTSLWFNHSTYVDGNLEHVAHA